MNLFHRPSHKEFILSIVFMLLSGFCISLIALIGKFFTSDFTMPFLIFIRFFAPCLLLYWMGVITELIHLDFSHLPSHFARAFFVVLGQYCLFYYLSLSTILNATLLYSTSPIFLPLISRVILKEPIKKKTWISIILSFIGVCFVMRPSHEIFNYYGFIGLGSGFFNACSQITQHKLSKKQNAFSQSLRMYLLASILSGLLLILFWQYDDFLLFVIPNDKGFLWFMIFLLSVATISNQLFRSKAYKLVNFAASLGPFLYVSILFSIFYDWIFFNRLPTVLTLVGAGFIILSGIVMAVRKLKV